MVLRNACYVNRNTSTVIQTVATGATNGKIREAINDRAEWIDLYPLFLDEDGSIADQYSNDELHLHGAGYTVWADSIGDQVRVR